MKNIIDDIEVLHLLVTATGRYLSSQMDEGGLVVELSEFRKYRETIAVKGPSPSTGVDYVFIKANPSQVIYDGRHPKCLPFETVAPLVKIFHPIFDAFLSRHTTQPSKEYPIKT